MSELNDAFDAVEASAHKPAIAPEDEWRYKICFMPWVKNLKRHLAKIGPNNWIEWDTLVETHSMQILCEALRKIPADKRWPHEVAKTLDPKQSNLDQLRRKLRDLGLASSDEGTKEWGAVLQGRGKCKSMDEISRCLAWLVRTGKSRGVRMVFSSDAADILDSWRDQP